MTSLREYQDYKTHQEAFREMVGTLSSLEEDWKSCISPQVASTMEHQFPPPPVAVEEQGEEKVAQVLDSKLIRGKLWYLVEWKVLREDQERTAWEPDFHLTNSPYIFSYFHTLYPDKPGPNTSRV
ncbi:hypothetical protein O181_010927 [Austropuccinia psidii MF-1]|uniref:Chromo domain-containing protein n=1 Tax=Austropuccinia psidii MF-1 TaxID=1389203 RepID=A0A9Q3BUQ4_9BASI|nr:hypothetical protein [Austropuccinia psidii MF-1]